MDPLSWTGEGALGEIPGSVEMKLVDFPDAGYFSTNKPPQGEIWIRGGGLSEGYLDLEQETKESYTDDGWFKTGDIGEFDTKGQIKIIDRKKNLVKTLTGEYIALEKVSTQIPLLFTHVTNIENSSNPYTARALSSPISASTPLRTRRNRSASLFPRNLRSRRSQAKTALRESRWRSWCTTRS